MKEFNRELFLEVVITIVSGLTFIAGYALVCRAVVK